MSSSHCGKGVYQFVNKCGANVDGYWPIYARDEWTASGESYGGTPARAIWALLLGGLCSCTTQSCIERLGVSPVKAFVRYDRICGPLNWKILGLEQLLIGKSGF